MYAIDLNCDGRKEVSCNWSCVTVTRDFKLSIIASEHFNAVAENSLAVLQRNVAGHVANEQMASHLAPTQGGLEIKIPIRGLDDIVEARRSGRHLAGQMGCSGSRIALVLTAISELGRNIISYAGVGEIFLSRSRNGARDAIVVVARDQGPGIDDVSMVIDRSMYGSGIVAGNGGLGLSGLKLCMDRFSIESQPGAGTRVTCEVLTN